MRADIREVFILFSINYSWWKATYCTSPKLPRLIFFFLSSGTTPRKFCWFFSGYTTGRKGVSIRTATVGCSLGREGPNQWEQNVLKFRYSQFESSVLVAGPESSAVPLAFTLNMALFEIICCCDYYTCCLNMKLNWWFQTHLQKNNWRHSVKVWEPYTATS